MDSKKSHKDRPCQINLNDLIDWIFSINSCEIQDSLYTYFLFAISKRGSDFKNLSEKDFNLFREQLGLLLGELYHFGNPADEYLPERKEDTQ